MPPTISTPRTTLTSCVLPILSVEQLPHCVSTSSTLVNERKSRLYLDSLGYIESNVNGMLLESMSLAIIIALRDLTRSPSPCRVYHSYKEIRQLWRSFRAVINALIFDNSDLTKLPQHICPPSWQGQLIEPCNLPKLVDGSVLRFRFL